MRSNVCVCASILALLLLRAVRSLLKSRHRCDIYRGLPNDLGDCWAHTQTRARADTQEQTSVNWRQSRAVVDWERQRKKPRCWWGRYRQKKSWTGARCQLRGCRNRAANFFSVILPPSAGMPACPFPPLIRRWSNRHKLLIAITVKLCWHF